MAITFDTLEYAQTLIDAGFTDKQARTITQSQKAVLSESAENQLATKLDVLKLENKIEQISQQLRNDMEKNSQQLRNEMEQNSQTLRGEMQQLNSQLRSEMQQLRNDVKQDIQRLEGSISSLEKRFDSNMATMRMLGIAIFVALFGVWLKLLF